MVSNTALQSNSFARAYSDVTEWSQVYIAHAELVEEQSSYCEIVKYSVFDYCNSCNLRINVFSDQETFFNIYVNDCKYFRFLV